MRLTVQIDVRFRDIDVMGHVNNAVYFSYFEQARMAFFHQILGTDWDWNKHGIILVHNEMDYLLPVLLHDDLEVEVFGSDVGNKSIRMAYELFIQRDGKRIKCAHGHSVLVCYDHISQKTTSVPKLWKEKIMS